MKKIISTALLSFLLLITTSNYAANKYWVGNSGDAWTSTSSWSTSSGGTSGATVPISTGNDVAIFDGKASLGVPAYTTMTVDVTGATIAAGTLQINAGVKLTLSGIASSITFNGNTTSLVLSGYLNDGGNTLKLGGTMSYSYSVTATGVSTTSSTNSVTYTVAANSSLGLSVGQWVSGGGIAAPGYTQVGYITNITSTTITVTSLTAFTPAAGTLSVGSLCGVTTATSAAANGAASLLLASTTGIVAGTVLSTTGLVLGSVVTSAPANGSVNISPSVNLTAGIAANANVVYYNGNTHTGTGKLQFIAGNSGGSPATVKNIGGNNNYGPSLGNIEIGDGTIACFAATNGGCTRLTGSFKLNTNSTFMPVQQLFTMYDAVNNTNTPLTLANNSFVTITSAKNGGFAAVNDSKFSNTGIVFSFAPGANLPTLITCSPTSTVTDSTLSGASTNLPVSGPITYGNLNIYNAGTVTPVPATTTFAAGLADTIKGTLSVLSGLTTLNTGTLVMAPTSKLVVNSGATFNFNSKSVTLQSDATGTASISNLTGASITNASAVTQQVYIQGGYRAFRLIGHPFSTTVALNKLTSTIDITGNASDVAGGFTATSTNNPSAFYYDSSKSLATAWTPYTAADNTFSKYQGIRVMFRGAKGEGLAGETPVTSGATAGKYVPSAATISMTGTLNTGDQTIPVGGVNGVDSFTLVSNPFPSSISLTGVTGTNLTSSYYVWNPTSWTSSQKGNWVNISYATGSIIPAGSAFVVKTTDGRAGTIVIPESAKTSSAITTTILGGASKGESLGGAYNKVTLKVKENGSVVDQMELNFRGDAKASSDYLDGEKMMNEGLNFYALSADNKKLGIDSRPLSTEAVPLVFNTKVLGKYSFEIAEASLQNGTKLFLHDKHLNTITELKAGVMYDFAVTAQASSQGNRFEIMGKSTLLTTLSDQFVTDYSNKLQTDIIAIQANPSMASAINSLGQIITTKDAVSTTGRRIINDLSNSTLGFYYNVLGSGDEEVTVKAIKINK